MRPGNVKEVHVHHKIFSLQEKSYYLFVFSLKWDMRWLRAKETKDNPNSQAVPKIIVHKK